MNGTDRVRNPAKIRELTVEDTEIVRVWRAITADAVTSIPLVQKIRQVSLGYSDNHNGQKRTSDSRTGSRVILASPDHEALSDQKTNPRLS